MKFKEIIFKNINIIIILKLTLINLIFIYIIFEKIGHEMKKLTDSKNFNKINKINLDYISNKFAIIKYICPTCGLFAFYKLYLGCILSFIIKGYIPIIDLTSFPNIFNKLNSSLLIKNPWELFFNQPFGYSLEDVKKRAKTIKYFRCTNGYDFINYEVFPNKVLLNFWHNIAIKYIPIKNKFIKKAIKIKNKLFQDSNNILGILTRGTDYISVKPRGHPIPPNIRMIFKDIKKMNKKNKYDWFFITTEDDKILSEFIKEFGNKLKYIKKIFHFKYNYLKKEYLCYNNQIKGNLSYMKLYLINFIILSKCIDIITARTSGSICLFIMAEKFRNEKVYYLGKYH